MWRGRSDRCANTSSHDTTAYSQPHTGTYPISYTTAYSSPHLDSYSRTNVESEPRAHVEPDAGPLVAAHTVADAESVASTQPRAVA